MTKLISCLFAAAALSAPASSFAQISFTEGETLAHMLSLCIDKKDAIDVAKASAKGEGEEVWEAKAKCGNIPIQGAIVGKTVHKEKIGGKELKVVEILSPEGEVLAYFLTSAPVKPAVRGVDGKSLNLKPERNA